jgi:hypothetical protein
MLVAEESGAAQATADSAFVSLVGYAWEVRNRSRIIWLIHD